ncbi:MAG: hypothetical protein KF773_11060 [Deltaproteobacteria bacterium]|nr:hypothetical protein [Deltaproteobacteria bacterium]
MSAAEQLEPTVTEPMTWAEIRARYPDMWVDLVDIVDEQPKTFEFRTARVAGRGDTRREALAQSQPWRAPDRKFMLRFTGESVPPVPRSWVGP